MNLQKVTTKFEIEMSGGTKQFAMSVKQGDRATRYAEVTLLSYGERYEIPTGSTVTAYIRKPDRHKVYTPCEYDGAVVTVELNSQALAAAGTALCEIEVKSSDLEQVATSVTFEIEIEAKVKDEDSILSGDEMSLFDKTMKQYEAAEKARTQAEAEREQAETERANAETARVNAETERTNAETERASAETARASAETARASAESERVKAENARVQAENLRQESAQEAIDNANMAVQIASQINEASYILDSDKNVKYAFSIYAKRGVPHMTLTRINED